MPASILQITDPHLLPAEGARLLGVDSAASLDAVLAAALSERRADALIVSGDIAHEPLPSTYERARSLIARWHRGPVLWLAGNHDVSQLLTALAGEVDALRCGDWHIIAIDTHTDGAEGGHVRADEFQSLCRRLNDSDARHVIVAGHHPPVAVGTPWLDGGCISNGAELLDVLASDSRVKAYVCGHVHQEGASVQRGVHVLTTPSTCFQFVAGTQRFTVDTTPPGWRWLELGDDGNLTTRVGRAHDFAVTLDLSTFRKH